MVQKAEYVTQVTFKSPMVSWQDQKHRKYHKQKKVNSGEAPPIGPGEGQVPV